MDIKPVFCLTMFILLFYLLCISFGQVNVNASNGYRVHNLDTGLHYATIQEAIDANETLDGHTIFVEAGIYYEHVVVNKILSLIGEDKELAIIDGNGTGTTVLIESWDVSLKRFTIRHGYDGILINMEHQIPNHIVIDSNVISDNSNHGLDIEYGVHNIVKGNTIENNDIGVYLGGCEDNITIYQNEVKNNTQCGIQLDFNLRQPPQARGSHNSLVVCNNITENGVGVQLLGSNNRFYYNNFVNNSIQVTYIPPADPLLPANVWNDSVEGNYWSNYTSVDLNHDGIGDSWHEIDESNVDHYPLMGLSHSYDIFWIEPGFTVNLVSNSSVSNFNVAVVWIDVLPVRVISFNVTGEPEYGFCRLCIPKALTAPPYTIIINQGLTQVLYYNDSICDNGTHRWICFAYEHSTNEVAIVPEFSSFFILPLFMIVTLLTVIIYRTKNVNNK
jgi:parallel beta-helix repeat protein